MAIGIGTKSIFGIRDAFKTNDSVCYKSWSRCVWQSGVDSIGERVVNDGD